MFHLKTHSDFSLLQSTASVKQIVSNIKKQGMDGCALTDYGSISGAIQFITQMQDAKLKPIIGNQFYVRDGKKIGHLTVLAKNLEGK